LFSIIASKITPDSIVYTGSHRSYSALDVSKFYNKQINHSKLFAKNKNHINGMENFWNQLKRVLRKHNGVDGKFFPLFLKECKFRFNHGMPKQQLKTLRLWCNI